MIVELAVQKALQNQTQKAPDPTASVMSGFELAMTMMDKARNFVNPAAAVEREPASLGDALMAHGDKLLGILQSGLVLLAQPKVEGAKPATVHQVTQDPQQVKALTVNPANHPKMEREREESLEIVEELNLNHETAEVLQPILGVLNEFAPKLIGFLESPVPAEMLASQLAGMIGPDLEDSAIALSEVVKEKGVAILGIRFPRLATEKAGKVVQLMAEKLIAERG